MKKTYFALALIVAASASADSVMKPVNDEIPGTLSGRIQSLSMYRDFENTATGDTGANTTIGGILGYQSENYGGLDFGAAYNFADEVLSENNSPLLANDDIHVLNEAWMRYSLEAAGLSNSTVTVGRKINNAEVFRADDFRQKARAIEAVQLESGMIPGVKLTAGHAVKMSSWIDKGDLWKFNDFGEVFNKTGAEDTDGITWVEGVLTGLENLEVALFDACAWDVANLIGARTKYNLTEETALLGYVRHESDIGEADTRNSDAYGLSLLHKIGDATTVEGGYFGVHGSKLRFEEATTGINHALGSSMIVYAGQFDGGADTAYLKAVTKVRDTVLYALYNYTWHKQNAFDGQELNIVLKQKLTDQFSIAFKGGVGYRDRQDGDNTTATDARLFVTYTF